MRTRSMEIEVNLRRYRWTPLYYEASKKILSLGYGERFQWVGYNGFYED